MASSRGIRASQSTFSSRLLFGKCLKALLDFEIPTLYSFLFKDVRC